MHSTYYGYIIVGEDTNTAEVEIADSIRQGLAQRIVSLPQKFKDDPRFAWAQDPNELWRRAGRTGHGAVAHEIRISLNPNLPLDASGRVLREAVQEHVGRDGNAADIIIFSKPVEGEVQYQAVVFQTARQITPEGFGDRTPTEEERLFECDEYWEEDTLNSLDDELQELEESELYSMYENNSEKGDMSFSEWMSERGLEEQGSTFLNGAFYGRVLSDVDPQRFEKIMSSAPTEGLANIPEYAQDALRDANDRYLAFMGILNSGAIPKELTRDDKERYAHLYAETPEGGPLVIGENEIEFMHQVSGFPREWCAAWTHGEVVELVAAGVVKGDTPERLIESSYQEALQADAHKQQGYSVDELVIRTREQAAAALLKIRESKTPPSSKDQSPDQGPTRKDQSDDNAL